MVHRTYSPPSRLYVNGTVWPMTDGMEVMNPLPTTRFATLVPTLLSIAQQCTVAEHGLTTARTRGTSSPATETTTSQTPSLCDTGYVVTRNRCVASSGTIPYFSTVTQRYVWHYVITYIVRQIIYVVRLLISRDAFLWIFLQE